jgi:hypothetical protein
MWHVSFCQHVLYRIRKVRGMDVQHRGPPGLCTKKWHSRNIKPYQRTFDLNLRCASPFKILIILSKTYMHNVSHGQVTEDNVSHVNNINGDKRMPALFAMKIHRFEGEMKLVPQL